MDVGQLLATMRHPGMRRGYEYWNGLRRDGALPRRADIQPADIKDLLPHVALLDVIDNGERFRYRLVGTSIAHHFGYDFTGRYMDEMFKEPDLSRFLGWFREAVRGKRIHYVSLQWKHHNKPYIRYERVLLPLAEADGVVNMLMSVTYYDFINADRPPPDYVTTADAEVQQSISLPT